MKENLYTNLLIQAEKIRRHCRQGSYKTRERYFEAFKRFIRYVAKEFRLQRIANIQPKHIFSYVEYLKENEYAPSTIKTDLSAIRFWQDQIPGARNTLPTNAELTLERRTFGGVDRTWSRQEFASVLAEATLYINPDYAEILTIARYNGLRIHEIFRLDTATVRNTVKTEMLLIKGKGGKMRKIPLAAETKNSFERMLKKTSEGHKLFVAAEDKTHLAINRFQQFVTATTKRLFPSKEISLTTHGLRHTWAAENYQLLVERGFSESVTKRQISRWLGHEREDVTNIYLASLEKEDCQ